jgi:hypothetical protein
MPISPKNRIAFLLLAALLGMSVGLTLITLPTLLQGTKTDSLVQLLHVSLDNGSMLHAALLFAAAGIVWGVLFKSPYSVCAVLMQPGGLFLLAIIEVIRDPTSHNLWPFEFMIYFGLWISGILGMLASIMLKKIICRLFHNLHSTP